ncbi:hypothetical protein ACI75Y_04475 [Capnocytophaga stomatis]|uniref:hypothetical protein n=1 Tax=Capnocytophaga stomatis TaxID=1848904 RepID=UPI001950345C|nr:hypothetical protein [Capnocytophaga stomatis]GIJ93870.1 hypothetical protein CAPN002_10880 [Capnocytophaga stomatis]
MTPKTKAFLFNFICFGAIFITIRLGVNYFFPELKYLFASLISGAVTIFISPRFAAVPTDKGEKLFMKWIFFKGVKQIGD